MSCSKRPFDGQDPDYEDNTFINEEKRPRLGKNANTELSEHVTSIIEREFGSELVTREKEVMEIQQRLHEAQKMLHTLRYGVVSSFYGKKQGGVEEAQKRIHPAVKKLIGKEPRTWEPLQRRPSKYRSVTSEKKKETDDGADAVCKMPRYIPPKFADKVLPVNPSRGLHHKTKKRVVIGNISKWVPLDTREDAASHKWMMYVRGPKDFPDISGFVSKVRFFLHPSYQPHDVVEVTSSPFHLSRRGWGEFPVRVQIHFCDPRNKPVDLIHQLKLDRTYTGLQTLGAETVVDLWLNSESHPGLLDHDKESTSVDSIQQENESENVLLQIVPKVEPVDSQEQEIEAPVKEETGENSVISSFDSIHQENESENVLMQIVPKVEPVDSQEQEVVKEETGENSVASRVEISSNYVIPSSLDHDYIGSMTVKQERDLHNIEDTATLNKCVSSDGMNTGVSNVQDVVSFQDAEFSGVQEEVCSVQGADVQASPVNGAITSGTDQNHERTSASKCTTLVKCMDRNGRMFYLMLGKTKVEPSVKVGNCVSILRNKLKPETNIACLPLQSNNVKPTLVLKDGQLFLLKKQQGAGLSLLKKQTSVKSSDAEDTRLLLSGRTLVLNKANSRLVTSPNKVQYRESLSFAVQSCNFDDTALAARWLLKHMPLISRSAADPEFRMVHPYSAPDEATFLGWNVGKQKAAEWLRAKAVHRVLQERFPENRVWSTRSIAVWARLHGYTPVPSPASRTTEVVDSAVTVHDTYSEPTGVTEWLENSHVASCDEESEVDVLSTELPHSRVAVKQECGDEGAAVEVHRLDPQVEEQCLFVRETVRKLGIKLVPQELIPGVVSCTVERLLLEAMWSLVDDLLRRSLCMAWNRSANRHPDCIVIDDVRRAILNRPELELFSNSGLGVEIPDSDRSRNAV